MMIRLFFVAAVSIVSAVSAAVPTPEVGHDPSRAVTRANFTFYTNAQPAMGAVVTLLYITPFLHSACAVHNIDSMSVYAGNSKVTPDGKFECSDGKENCKWLKTMNCIADKNNADIDTGIYLQQIMLSDVLLGRGPGQLVEWEDVSDCLEDQDLVAEIFGEAIHKTQKAIDWSKEALPIGLTINEKQVEAGWQDHLFKHACDVTNSPLCCVLEGDSTPSKNAVISKLLKKPKAVKNTDILASTSLKAVSTTPPTSKHSITVYLNGNQRWDHYWVTMALANALYSPCAKEFSWNIVQAGELNETSSGHFTCKPDDCKWLEGINCIASYLPDDPLLKAQGIIALSVLAHGTIDNLLANISEDLGAKMKTCIANGTGARLLSAAVKETHKLPDLKHYDAPWSMINGKEESAFWDNNIFDTLCEASGEKKVCCDRKFPHEALEKKHLQTMDKLTLAL